MFSATSHFIVLLLSPELSDNFDQGPGPSEPVGVTLV